VSTAIILAGGLGTRLRSEVPDLPKPMAPINGRPFLSYLMDYWIGQGVCRIILSVGYKSHAIQDYYGDCYKDAALEYSVEETLLGTGGGLLWSLRKLQDEKNILVLNGDTFFAVDMAGLKKSHESTCSDVTMALLDVADNDRYGGVSMDQDGHVMSLDSSREGATNRRVNGGVYLMSRHLFEGCDASALPQRCSLEDELFPTWLNSGESVSGYLSSGMFIDIGVPEDYKRASLLLAEPFQ